MKENSEQILVSRLLQKEEAAWKELFEAYSGGLAYVCSRYIIDRDLVNAGSPELQSMNLYSTLNKTRVLKS